MDRIPIACACRRGEALVRCRQWWLCGDCQVQRAAEKKFRISQALQSAFDADFAEWEKHAIGIKPRFVLLTLTVRHSGSIAADRESLNVAWRKFYKKMNARWGKFPYAGVWEITPGRCKTCEGYTEVKPNSTRARCHCEHPKPEGHVHCHIVAIWRYRDYDKVKRLYRAATRDDSYINIIPRRKDGKPTTARSAAKYIAKYISKGVQGESYTPELRADVSAAMYNAHGFMVSRGFWLPRKHECKKCKHTIRRVTPCKAEIFDRIPERDDFTGKMNRYWLTRVWDPLRDSERSGALAFYAGQKTQNWEVTE